MSHSDTEIDYYAILGLEVGADQDEIRRAYRRLMQGGHHPDRGGDPKQAAMINKAYAFLSDTESRADYDLRMEVLRKVAEGFTMTQARRAVNPDSDCQFCGMPHLYGTDMQDMICESCGSPLQPIGEQRLEAEGQRAIARIDKSVPIEFYLNKQQKRGHKAMTEDVSPHGLRMSTGLSLQPGQRLRIVTDVLDAVGEVTYCSKTDTLFRTQTTVGVSFITLRYKQQSGAFVSRRI